MEIKKALKAASVTMQYADGGKTQVFTVDGTEYRVPGHLHCAQAIAVIKAQQENVA